MRIALANDHAGYRLKELIKNYLINKGYEVNDFGSNSNESSDYPDYAHPMAGSVGNNENDIGISFCGSGNGINMVANKHKGVRSALCWNVEIAELARKHNNANICAIPSRFISDEEAIKVVDKFLVTGFDGGRHQRRVDKIQFLK
ncbi:MAG: ribose 5-phosphate isomerase B [Bacteroidales bacterium]|nr:ribose 5-phosphate isomerase B [Bacteroidales bacterium]